MTSLMGQVAARTLLYPAVLVLKAARSAMRKALDAMPNRPGPVSVRIEGCFLPNGTKVGVEAVSGRTSRVSHIDVLREDLKEMSLDLEAMLDEAEAAGRRNRVRFGPCRNCGKMAMYGFLEFRGPRHSGDECLARQVLET